MAIPITTKSELPSHLAAALGDESVSAAQMKAETEPTPTLEEARAAVDADAEKARDEAMRKERYGSRTATIPFRYENAQGVFEGEFQNKVLNLKERRDVGVFRARLAGGLPFDTLDPFTRELTLVVAHLSFSLTKKPKWADDLEAIEDYNIIYNLYEEVMAHERTFLGG